MNIKAEDFFEISSLTKESEDSECNCQKGCFAKIFINTRCSENSLFITNCCVGVIIILMQVVPMILQNWIYIIEPRTINMTDDKGEQMEAPFLYTAGYFKVCRTFEGNFTFEISRIAYEKDFKLSCFGNPIYNDVDLSDYSFATIGILTRLLLPTSMHLAGATICFLAFLFGVVGFVKKNGYNVVSAIFYVFGGLTLSMAVLQFISVVDDEMQPRMKPKGTGEPSSFSYTYGIPFTIAALSFMPVQLCVYLQIQIYFKRYPSAETKTKIVPGLQILLAQARKKERFCHRSETGTTIQMPMKSQNEKCHYNSFRQGTRSSRDFTTYSIQRDLALSPPLTASSIPMQDPFKFY